MDFDKEQTSDADASNAALAELERELRSGDLGKQCAAIIKVPVFFKAYPFPIFINATVLKLADVFRDGTNFIRQTILRVMEECSIHIENIISVDTIIKRVIAVSHSNDPIARALSLRLMGCFACVVKDKKSVHHLISVSLDSHDPDEVTAAIFAAEKFAEYSVEFGNGIFDKVSEKLSSIAVEMETKLQLISIFKHMHSSPEATEKIFRFCVQKLLPEYPTVSFVTNILRTLTELVSIALFHTPDQLTLLLEVLRKTTRKAIRVVCLQCLHKLAKRAPHMWTNDHVNAICAIARSTKIHQDIRLRALDVLAALCSTQAVNLFSVSSDSSILPLCKDLMFSSSAKITVRILYILVCLCENIDDELVKEVLIMDAQSSLLILMPTIHQSNIENTLLFELKLFCHSAITLASLATSEISPIARCACYCLVSCQQDNIVRLLMELLSALCDRRPELYGCASSLIPLSPEFLTRFLELGGKFPSAKYESSLKAMQLLTDLELSGWILFKVARVAMKNGYYQFAFMLLDKLSTKVSYVNRHWLKGLVAVCEANCALISSSVDDEHIFELALANYTKLISRAILSFKVVLTENASVWFAVEYCSLQFDTYTAIGQLLTCLSVSPLIGIRNSSNDRLVGMLKNSADALDQLVAKWQTLERRCFDAEADTICHLHILQEQLRLMSGWIGVLCGLMPEESFSLPSSSVQKSSACSQCHLARLRWAHGELVLIPKKYALLDANSLELFKRVIEFLFRQPVYFPRFLFQRQQTTKIKLEIFPSAGTDRNINLTAGEQLALKLEGFISQTSSKDVDVGLKNASLHILRRVESVLISICVEPTGKNGAIASAFGDKHATAFAGVVQKQVQPRHGFFAAEFLLDLSQTSFVTVAIDYVDSVSQSLWSSGVAEKLKVTTLSTAEMSRKAAASGVSFTPTAAVAGSAEVQLPWMSSPSIGVPKPSASAIVAID